MRAWFFVVLGLLGMIMGTVWTLQGVGYLGGSAMTGETLWAVLGPIVAVAGLALAVLGLRRLRSSSPSP